MRDIDYDHTVPRRSEGTRQDLRPAQDWPSDRPFKLLSIDGGGVRGLLPALILAGLEDRFLGGDPIGKYFDMITGTSTGGIIALGLGLGLRAKDIANLYLERGERIFPPGNAIIRQIRRMRGYVAPVHDRRVLEAELRRVLGHANFGDSSVPLCIPAFEGRYGEPYIFKTPHHPDYKRDGRERMVDVALSTAAAPTIYEAVERDGYTFVDGGVWANNPVMIGVIDALTCFRIERRQTQVLSLGTGRARLRTARRVATGGKLHWASQFVSAAMAAQSHNALGQAYLLLGKDHVIRLDGPETEDPVEMDDASRAIAELPGVAAAILEAGSTRIASEFLGR